MDQEQEHAMVLLTCIQNDYPGDHQDIKTWTLFCLREAYALRKGGQINDKQFFIIMDNCGGVCD